MAFSRLLNRYIDDPQEPRRGKNSRQGWYAYITASFCALTSE